MAAQPRTTLLEVLQQVCLSVGHPAPVGVDDPDPAVQRMRFYANQAGLDLLTMNSSGGWSGLLKSAEINIQSTPSPGNAEQGYDLPADFGVMVDDTQWNKNTQLPAVGPVDSQDWQWMVVRNALITTRFMWRIRAGQLWIKSPPSDIEVFRFEYISKNWAFTAADVPTDYMTDAGDYHGYPWNLVVLFTRAKWLEGEGYESTMAHRDFQRVLQYMVGTDKGATTLSLVPGVGFPYLDVARNIPDTGYGA